MSLNTVKAMLILNAWTKASRAAAALKRKAKKTNTEKDFGSYKKNVEARFKETDQNAPWGRVRAERLKKLFKMVSDRKDRVNLSPKQRLAAEKKDKDKATKEAAKKLAKRRKEDAKFLRDTGGTPGPLDV